MSKEPNRNVYVGHRYVPLILEEWDNKISYEGLSVVTHKGASYTSKKRVPVGIDILNKEFWSLTGNYNAQVDYYRDETERVAQDLLLKSDQTYVDTELGKKANQTYVDTELGKKANKTYVDTELGKKSDKTYVDTELGKKSDKTYVDTELDKKSDQTYVDTELDEINTELTLTKKHTEGALNAKTYNAVGDGINDDTAYLQQMFIDAYRNKKSVKIPSGEYLISKPILIIADNNELESSIQIAGENLENTVIKCSSNFSAHLETGALSNKAAFIVVNETYLNADNTFKNGTGITHSVFIENLYLLCENKNVDYAVLFATSNASSSYKRIRTRGFVKAGFKNLGNFYLNVLEKIRVDDGQKSFDFSSGANTSLKIDSCYSVGASVAAYDIIGVYMNITNCAADGCTGTVFDLTGFKGVVVNPGSESDKVKTVFKGGLYTDVTITNPLTFANFTDDEFVCIDTGAGSNITIIGGEPAHDYRLTEEQTPILGKFIERHDKSFLSLENVKLPESIQNNSYESSDVYGRYVSKYGGVNTRYGNNLSYIGFDGSTEKSRYVDYNELNPSIAGNAIYFGMSTSPNKTALGKDLRYYSSVNVGDILLSQSPKEIGGLGWVNLLDTSKDINFNGVITEVNDDVITLNVDPYLENYNEHYQMPKQGWAVKSSSGGTALYYNENITNKTITLTDKSGPWNIGDRVILERVPYMARNMYAKIPIIDSGTTAQRTQNPEVGQMFFDTTIGKPIWYNNGGVWVDADGTTV